MSTYHQLIEELSQWNNGEGVSLSQWINFEGRFDLAIGIISIVWPEFIMFEGCILLERPTRDEFQNWMDFCKGDKTAVERVLNHRHIAELFNTSKFNPTPQLIIKLANVMKEMWTYRCLQLFPSWNCVVELIEPCGESLTDYQITLFLKRGNGAIKRVERRAEDGLKGTQILDGEP